MSPYPFFPDDFCFISEGSHVGEEVLLQTGQGESELANLGTHPFIQTYIY